MKGNIRSVLKEVKIANLSIILYVLSISYMFEYIVKEIIIELKSYSQVCFDGKVGCQPKYFSAVIKRIIFGTYIPYKIVP